ncbi:MAG: Na+/H+ antiporter subunit E [Marinilabiliaceae bacterium]
MKAIYFIYFFVYYALKVTEAGWAISRQIMSGDRGENGKFIEYHPRLQKSWHVVLLFNLITMTPGSLSVDIDDQNYTILVHLLNSRDEKEFLSVIKKVESLLEKALL